MPCLAKKVLEDMVRDIEEKFEKTSNELGIAEEYELKYSLENIEKFLGKVAKSEFAEKLKRLIFISKHGFTGQAAEYARVENIVLVKEIDIPGIKQLIMEKRNCSILCGIHRSLLSD